MSTPNATAGTTTTRSVWLVARREILTRVRTRAFVVGTVAILAIMAGYAALMMFIGQSAGSATVAFTGQATAVSGPLRTASARLGDQVETREVPDPATGERLVRDGELDALVTGAPGALRVVVNSDLDKSLHAALNGIERQQALNAELARSGLDPTAVRETVSQARVQVHALEPADPQRLQRMFLGLAASVLLYMFLIMFGQAVAQGVVEEKSSRVVELLLSTIRPSQLLAGKVIGVGLTGLLQFAIITAAGLGAALYGGLLTLPSAAVISTLGWSVAWFLLGFFLYATVLAAAASLVSRQEDLQSVVSPVMMVLAVPFVIGMTLLPDDPESPLAAALSLVPGLSPVLLPMRIAYGIAPLWQIAVAVVLNIGAIVTLLLLGGRIYSNAVLRTGARVKLMDALRTA